ncbi:adenylyltransferase/cytidyltransferase family protein [uncultured Alteromonas sp.]|jgi:glycerol-3-phosphate cytidylyltransferase|uniref:adenylyltransferase/cytidyltransferase family protein n=1 Tax=uncultured Alteromonas sp. TaxID=179113 RepID=UPI0030DA4B30
MTTVVTYGGTFDLFHIGHVRLLKRLRGLGDRLVVGLSSDEFNSVKNKNAIIPYEDRRENASIFAMGADWIGKFDDLQDVVRVVSLSRTQDVSTTELKTASSEIRNEKNRQIQSLASHLRRLIEKL